MPGRMAQVGHLNQNRVAQLDQLVHAYVTIYLWVFRKRVIDNMLALEFRPILIETVSDKYGNVIQPGVSGSCRE